MSLPHLLPWYWIVHMHALHCLFPSIYFSFHSFLSVLLYSVSCVSCWRPPPMLPRCISANPAFCSKNNLSPPLSLFVQSPLSPACPAQNKTQLTFLQNSHCPSTEPSQSPYRTFTVLLQNLHSPITEPSQPPKELHSPPTEPTQSPYSIRNLPNIQIQFQCRVCTAVECKQSVSGQTTMAQSGGRRDTYPRKIVFSLCKILVVESKNAKKLHFHFVFFSLFFLKNSVFSWRLCTFLSANFLLLNPCPRKTNWF